MKITDCEVFRYRLPLVRPLVLRGRTLRERRGLLLRLTSDEGGVGWGEAAPLPGFSSESLESAEREMLAVKALLPGSPVTQGCFTPRSVQKWKNPQAASVRCAVELALFDLWLDQTRKRRRGSFELSKEIAVNGLLSGTREEISRDARILAAAGYRAFKLKVGVRPLREEIAITGEIREITGNGVALRLDANRAWSFEQAVDFCRSVELYGVEYLEEPLADPTMLPALSRETGMPLAMDESLVELSPEKLQAWPEIKAVILKPTLLGGLRRSVAFAAGARKLGMKTVVSSSFESGIGILGLARFAAWLSRDDIPAGLDTYRWLERDLLAPRISMANGRMDVPVRMRDVYTVKPDFLRDLRDG